MNPQVNNSAAKQDRKKNDDLDILPYEEVRKMDLDTLRQRYGWGRKNGLEFQGANHVAWVSSDMARTVWFWSEGLGMRLTKTIELQDGGQHFFIDGGNGCSIAYFWFPDAPAGQPGVTTVNVNNVSTGSFSTAIGGVNHVAWNVKADKLREYRKRIKKLGYFCSPILYHTDEFPSGYGPEKNDQTTWESFYFCDPDGGYFELTAQTDRKFSPEVDVNHRPKTVDDLPSKL